MRCHEENTPTTTTKGVTTKITTGIKVDTMVKGLEQNQQGEFLSEEG